MESLVQRELIKLLNEKGINVDSRNFMKANKKKDNRSNKNRLSISMKAL